MGSRYVAKGATKQQKGGAVKHEEIQDLREKAIEISKISSPDLNSLQKVKVDKGTYIYIKPGKDPELAKKNWLKKRDASKMSFLKNPDG